MCSVLGKGGRAARKMSEERADDEGGWETGCRVVMLAATPCDQDARVAREAQCLAERGFEVWVVCEDEAGCRGGERWGKVRQLTFRPRGQARKGFGAQRSRTTLWHSAGEGAERLPWSERLGWVRVVRGIRFLSLPKIIENAAGERVVALRPRVIHAHDLVTLPAAVRIAQRAGARVVYDAHELERHRNGLGLVGRALAGRRERQYIRRADAVVTVSDSIAEWLMREYEIDRPVVVLNSPAWSGVRKDADNIRQRLGLDARSPIVAYVGKVTFNRGIEQLVGALSYLPNWHVALLGSRDEGTVARIEALASRLEVAERVHMVEPVDASEVMSFIATADVGAVLTQDTCLSYRFSMPNKLFEMSFAGLPLCVSDLPEQRRFVEEIGNGVVVDGSAPEDIAKGLARVYAERQEFHLTEDRRATLAARYGWPLQADRLVGLYRALLSGERSGGKANGLDS